MELPNRHNSKLPQKVVIRFIPLPPAEARARTERILDLMVEAAIHRAEKVTKTLAQWEGIEWVKI